jgi:putative ABC transport system permease protein
MKSFRFVEAIWQDLRYGVRVLVMNPSFAVVAILSLALGIGANTAIFQLLDAVRLRTLPVKNPQELAMVQIANRDWASGRFSGRNPGITNPMWEQIRDRQQGFSGIFAWGTDSLNLASGGQARYARSLFVSGDFFNVLGVPPLLGRLFNAADDRRGCGSPGVVISYPFWQREFGGDRGAIGRKLSLEGHGFEVIGITPASFYGVEVGRTFDVAVPLCAEPIIRVEESSLNDRRWWWLAVIGRLKPGTSREQATAQLSAISPAVFQETVPPVYTADAVKHYLAYKLGAFPGATGVSSLRRNYESPLWLLLAIAGLVLLIACANLANLTLARASAREREIAVRLALGASRGRLVRQLLAESLLLATVGAAVGTLLAMYLSQFLVTFLSTQGSPLFLDLEPDWRLLAFTSGLAVLTCILFGLAPALRATRTEPSAVMKATGRGMTASRERFGLRRVLVVSQVALSLVLLVGAMLFVRSLRNLLTVDAGFQQTGILITDIDLTRLNIPKERRQAFKKEYLDRLRSISGVEAAAEATIVPVSGSGWNQSVVIGQEKKGDSKLNRVSGGFFKTMGTPLLAGRDFDDRDTATSPKVAVVSESFARKYLSGGNPIGKTFRLEQGPGEPDPIYEVVGIVKDTKYYTLRDDFEPIGFFPMSQDLRPDPFDEIIIRSNMPLTDLIASVKRTMGEVSPEITIDFHVFKTQIQEGLLRERLMATLSGFFGFLAGLLATIGLYGVISYMVVRRTNEIGIRMALGATPQIVLSMIMREAGVLLGIGIVVGSVLAVVAAKAASKMLFGLKPHDPITLIMAIAALAAVAAAASYLPAHRAAKLEPMTALRDE